MFLTLRWERVSQRNNPHTPDAQLPSITPSETAIKGSVNCRLTTKFFEPRAHSATNPTNGLCGQLLAIPIITAPPQLCSHGLRSDQALIHPLGNSMPGWRAIVHPETIPGFIIPGTHILPSNQRWGRALHQSVRQESKARR